jgi:hypothetical protein
MDSFAFWLDKPFNPRLVSKPICRRTRVVTIRYRGSFSRSAIKTLIVIMLLAIMSNVMGERKSQNPDTHMIPSEVGSAGVRR